jgi:hypothetical protein
MFARCLETAERTARTSSSLGLEPKADPWADPRASSDASKRDKRPQAGSSSRNAAAGKSSWWK